MKKIYYNKTKNLAIENFTGTLAQIKKVYGKGVYEILEIDETKEETYTITDDHKLKKYSLAEERQKQEQKEQEYQDELKQKRDVLRAKLNLSEDEFMELKEVFSKLK